MCAPAGSQERNDEWPSLPGALQPSASGSKLNAAAKDFTPPGSEHGGAAAAAAPPAEANGLLPYRPYVPQPMPAPQVSTHTSLPCSTSLLLLFEWRTRI